MYKATTYFTSIFAKLNVADKEIRQKISSLYGGLVKVVLYEVPESRRIPVLKFISLSIKDTVSYLKILKQQNKELDLQTLRMLRSLIDLTKEIITRIGLRTARSGTADRILNEVFLTDIACDIGECVRDFKNSASLRAKIEIFQRLKVLINDYNTVQQTNLTIRDVLKNKNLNEKEEL